MYIPKESFKEDPDVESTLKYHGFGKRVENQNY